MKNFSALMALTTTLMLTFNTPSQAHEHNKPTYLGDLVISQIWARTTPNRENRGRVFYNPEQRQIR